MLKIRKVQKSDYPNLKKIKPELDLSKFEKRLDAQSKSDIIYFILFSGKNPAGSAVLNLRGKPTHTEYPDIEDLYIHTDMRRKGFAQGLVIECEFYAEMLGFRKVGLAVNPKSNLPALDLYLKLGYQKLNEPTYLDGVYDGIEDWVIDLEKVL